MPPSAFATSWANRPLELARVGLRLVSESDAEGAIRRAATETTERFADMPRPFDEGAAEAWRQTYNALLKTGVLARALCKADDVTRSFFDVAPELTIRNALTPEAIEELWEAYAALRDELSPLVSPAAEEDVREVIELAASLLEAPDSVGRTRALRLVTRLRDDLRALLP